MRYKSLILVIMAVTLPVLVGTANAQRKNTVEASTVKCENVPREQRPRIRVTGFDVTRVSAQSVFGKELASMLVNSLNKTGCFNVLESLKNIGNSMEEMKLNQSGVTDGSGPETGRMKGAQLIVTGEVTEFKENKIGALAVGVNQAHIGFILRIVDPQTTEVLWSESVQRKVTRPGLKIFNADIISFGTQAMEDALEKAILDAVGLIVGQRELIEAYRPKQSDVELKYDRNTCPINRGGSGPTVMVIIPEIHITRRVPDPAGETEIIKTLINAGFKVIDPSVYKAIRDSEEFGNAVKNQDAAAASKIGSRFGADIIIFGEAFSESTGIQNGMQSCRARVEARAVSTFDAQILGADGRHAGGSDNSELVAGKAALRSAGSKMGTYFVNTLCEAQGVKKSTGGTGESSSEIVLSNATYTNAGKVETYLKTFKGVKSVVKNFSSGVARFTVTHTGSLDNIASALDSGKTGVSIIVTGVNGSKIEGNFK